MRTMIAATAILCVACVAPAVAAGTDRYLVIVEKHPFGEHQQPVVQPVQTQPAETTVPPQVFNQYLTLHALVDRDGETKAGFVETKTGTCLVLRPGDVHEGIEVVSIDYEEQQVTLRRDGQTCVMRLDQNASAAEPSRVSSRIQTPGSVRPGFRHRGTAAAEAPVPAELKEAPAVRETMTKEEFIRRYEAQMAEKAGK